jgi:hypothetical protein
LLKCRDDGFQIVAMFARDRFAIPPHLLDDWIPAHDG